MSVLRSNYLNLGFLLGVIALISSVNAENVNRPNIVFLLADDLGYTDIAPYGSEVATPNLSQLASEGTRFTNYHTAANCAPARAMLLTGVSSHLAGVPNIPEMMSPAQKLQDNYQGVLGNNVVTIATLLEDTGYHTYLAGKWHLGATPGKLPSERGFERTFALMDSGADNFEQRPYLPIYDQANWFADGERTQLPDDFYSSKFLIDKTIEFIDSNLKDGKPFFAYVPFQAVHIPVQAPQEYIERYMGRYDEGWHKLRQERHARAASLGIVPGDIERVEASSTMDWETLSPQQRRYESKRMAVYAGMIEAMDVHIGRLVTYLRETNQFDNTVFIFTSDNGAEGSGPQDPTSFSSRQGPSSLGYNTDYETLGLKGSFNSINPGFTSAAVGPLSYYKFYVGEGGLRVPLIVSGKPLGDVPEQTAAFAWATDIAATIISLAGVEAPGRRYGGRPILPMTGKDLTPIVSGEVEGVYSEDDAIGYELTGHSALFMGDYKVMRNLAPLGDGEWRLFNIVKDPGEARDLKSEMPERFERMISAYEQFTVENRVQPLPEGYSQGRQIIVNALRERLGSGIIIGLLLILLLMPLIVYVRMRRSGGSY